MEERITSLETMSPIFEPLREQEKTAKDIGGKLEARTTRNHTGALQKEKKTAFPNGRIKPNSCAKAGMTALGKFLFPINLSFRIHSD